MGLARRACDWEQGERVPPGVSRWDLVAAVRERVGNAHQSTSRRHPGLSTGMDDETDDSAACMTWSLDRVSGSTESGVRFRLWYLPSWDDFATMVVGYADVAELADAIDLGSIARKGVEVRVLSSAPDQWSIVNCQRSIVNFRSPAGVIH